MGKRRVKKPTRKEIDTRSDVGFVLKLGCGGIAAAGLLSLGIVAIEEEPSSLRYACRAGLATLSLMVLSLVAVYGANWTRVALASRAAASSAAADSLAAAADAERIAASKASVAAANTKARNRSQQLQRERRAADEARYAARAEQEEARAAALRGEMELRDRAVLTAAEKRQWARDRARMEQRRAAAERAAATWRCAERESTSAASVARAMPARAIAAATPASAKQAKMARRRLRRLERRRARELAIEGATNGDGAPATLGEAGDDATAAARLNGGSAPPSAESAESAESEESEESEDEESRGASMPLHFFASRADVLACSNGEWERTVIVRFVGLKLWRIATVQPDVVTLALACDKCGARGAQATVSGRWGARSTFALRCLSKGCGYILRGALKPALVHAGSAGNELGDTICVVETKRCAVVDIVFERSRMLAMCEACDDGVHFGEAPDAVAGGAAAPAAAAAAGKPRKCSHGSGKPLRRGVRSEALCRACHLKLAFEARTVALTLVSGDAPAAAPRTLSKGGRGSSANLWAKQRRQLGLVEGKPLPREGACRHYKKSLKWLRYPCCGMAYPCPLCHAEGGAETCPAAAGGAAVHANRMICGACSREQGLSATCESCGSLMGAKKGSVRATGGTEKGHQQRSRSGVKTMSNKSKRVGAAAARIRDQKAAGRRKVTV
jgi:uncharacterized CHY-type Zn-finger protein